MIVLHDCWPKNEFYAHDARTPWEDLEALNTWNGTTWRAFYKQWLKGRWRAYLINADWGIGVIDTSEQQPLRSLSSNWGLHSLETYKKSITAAGDCLTFDQATSQLTASKPSEVPNEHGWPEGYWSTI